MKYNKITSESKDLVHPDKNQALKPLISDDSAEAIENIDKDLSILKIHSFNMTLILKNPYLEKYLYLEHLYCLNYKRNELLTLLNIDSRGDKSANVNGLSTSFYYDSADLYGWSNLLQTAHSLLDKKLTSNKTVIIDFLAANGRLAKKINQLALYNSPTVIGMDTSQQLAEQAQKANEIVFWASHETLPFKSDIADVTVAAYVFHSIPLSQREGLIESMKNPLRKGGLTIIYDFEKGGSTAKWYTEIVCPYRASGEPFLPLTRKQLGTLLNSFFKDTITEYIYDPFYLEGKEGQDAGSLKREFYSYIIELFNLQKLLPENVEKGDLINYRDLSYWQHIDTLLSPYFTLTKAEEKEIEAKGIVNNACDLINKFNVPFVEELTLKQVANNKICLIAPRVSLVGIGYDRD
jgi:ubiquinone/menaquinone biosynthesis C-methylase UbiE